MIEINHEYYVSLEIAKLLEQAGFDWKCYKVYKTDITENSTLLTYTKEEGYGNTSEFICSAPTLEVAQRWLREVKGYDIEIYVCHHYGISAEKGYFHELVINNEDYEDDDISSQFSRTYEVAQEAGIKKALEIILKKREYENN